jgi:hypothetical protein
MTAANKEKLLAARKAYVMSEETRERIAAAGRGRKQSPIAVEKMAATHRGRPHSLETRAKIAAAHSTPEAKARKSEARKGSKMPEHHRERLAAISRARPREYFVMLGKAKHAAWLKAREQDKQ